MSQERNSLRLAIQEAADRALLEKLVRLERIQTTRLHGAYWALLGWLQNGMAHFKHKPGQFWPVIIKVHGKLDILSAELTRRNVQYPKR